MPHTKSFNATGRRKTASARVNIKPAEGEAGAFVINNRAFDKYFPYPPQQRKILKPLELTERVNKYDIKIRILGGGTSGQVGAVVHGLSRALEKAEPELRPVLKKAGFLTRDSRIVERKKFGRHKARKRPQYSKR